MTKKEILTHVARIIWIVVILNAVVLCTRRVFSASEWDATVDVEYQYENEPDTTYWIHYNDHYSFNFSVKYLELDYAVTPGYGNRLVITSNIKTNPYAKTSHSIGQKELMYVPDRRFKVVKVVTNLSDRKEYRPDFSFDHSR